MRITTTYEKLKMLEVIFIWCHCNRLAPAKYLQSVGTFYYFHRTLHKRICSPVIYSIDILIFSCAPDRLRIIVVEWLHVSLKKFMVVTHPRV